MPPSVTDWLPEGHLAWFVLDVVKELDLSEFYSAFRIDGRGGAIYDPQMMLAVLLYGYCTGERSSRRIERRLVEDVAYRVVAANQSPDHATLARFRHRHEQAIAQLFTQVLHLCVEAGVLDTALIAIDGTKMEADASYLANRTEKQLAEEILKEAEEMDRAEDERFGDRRGDELEGGWSNPSGRRERIREALRQLEAQGPRDYESKMADRARKEAELGHKVPGKAPRPTSKRSKTPAVANTTDPDSRVMKSKGHGLVQGYNVQAAATAEQIVVAAEVTNRPADAENFVPMVGAVEETLRQAGHNELLGAIVADAGYWSNENANVTTNAEVLIAVRGDSPGGHRHSEKRQQVLEKVRKGELTRQEAATALDVSYPWLAQLLTDYVEDATSVVTDPKQRREILERLDRGQLTGRAAARELGVSQQHVRHLLHGFRNGIPDPELTRQQMQEKLGDPPKQALFRKRKTSIEPVFGNLKGNRGYRRFVRRGLPAVNSEWRLICATHNLLKLWRYSLTG